MSQICCVGDHSLESHGDVVGAEWLANLSLREFSSPTELFNPQWLRGGAGVCDIREIGTALILWAEHSRIGSKGQTVFIGASMECDRRQRALTTAQWWSALLNFCGEQRISPGSSGHLARTHPAGRFISGLMTQLFWIWGHICT